MKKTTLLLCAILTGVSFLSAQTLSLNKLAATGNTLFSTSFNTAGGQTSVYLNSTDMAAFQFNNEDKDGYAVDAALATSYSVVGGGPYKSYWMLMTNGTNFASGIGALFSAGDIYAANDWLSFGPITIPAEGATLKWKHQYGDPADANGYDVIVSTTGITSANFTSAPIFSLPERMDDPSVTTQWYSYSKNLAGNQTVYIAFHHVSTDKECMLLDDISIQSLATTGIHETENASVQLTQNIPNPFNKYSVIKYELQKSAAVSFTICDITGRQVMNVDQEIKTAGTHQITLDAAQFSQGVYFYTLKTDDYSVTKKMIVIE